MAQLSINRGGQTRYVAGDDPFGTKDLSGVDSAFNMEASAEMPFGCALKFGTAERTALLPSASNSVILGVNRWSGVNHKGTNGSLGTTGIKPTHGLSVRRKGSSVVLVDPGVVTIVPGTRAYVRFESDNGSNTQPGAFRNTDDGHVIDTRNQVQFKSNVFLAADGVTKVALVDFDFTNA